MFCFFREVASHCSVVFQNVLLLLAKYGLFHLKKKNLHLLARNNGTYCCTWNCAHAEKRLTWPSLSCVPMVIAHCNHWFFAYGYGKSALALYNFTHNNIIIIRRFWIKYDVIEEPNSSSKHSIRMKFMFLIMGNLVGWWPWMDLLYEYKRWF